MKKRRQRKRVMRRTRKMRRYFVTFFVTIILILTTSATSKLSQMPLAVDYKGAYARRDILEIYLLVANKLAEY